MLRDKEINDLIAFSAVAQERSFTRAAPQARRVAIGPEPHASAGLEARLGIRLLTRTTRSVDADRGRRAPAPDSRHLTLRRSTPRSRH